MRAVISATLLEKLARHMAFLACMAILFRSAGWLQTGQIAIWLLTVCASGFHLGARMLKRHQQAYLS